MTINNFDETDLALVQQGYPDHIRQLVYTLEEGEEGTPHIQAYIKMKRDCRLSHMKKLFPRGNFGYLDSSEYKLNSQRYAQKLDGTAVSPAVIQNGDPLHTIEGVIRLVIQRMIKEYGEDDETDIKDARKWIERDMVVEDYTMAKVFVSSTYKVMWKEFGHDMYECLFNRAQEEQAVEIPIHTHTHTHTAEVISQQDDINEVEERQSTSGTEQSQDSDDFEEGQSEADEGSAEGSDISDCEDADE